MSAHVVSVNVGRPAPLDTGRRTVSSAIVKAPVEGRVAVRGINLAGDDQADRSVHGGTEQAVYAYASEDTAWWSEQLDRPLGPGAFGENLTLAGLDVSGARVGERWRIGTVELRVTAPRVPCFKLGAVMGDQRFLRRFLHALRPGAYLAIAEEGELGAGDAVEIVHRPEHAVSIALVADALLIDRSRLNELDPARSDMLPKLAGWFEELRPAA